VIQSVLQLREACGYYLLFRLKNLFRSIKCNLLWPSPSCCTRQDSRNEVLQADLKSLFQISEHLNTDVKGIYTTFGRLDENKEAHLLGGRCEALRHMTKLCSLHILGQKRRVQWISSMYFLTVMEREFDKIMVTIRIWYLIHGIIGN
jgi:hypothetical protein